MAHKSKDQKEDEALADTRGQKGARVMEVYGA